MKIGIIGAGFMGRNLAIHAVRAGHEVMLSNSRGPRTLTSAGAAIKCRIGTVEEAAGFGDVVVLAFPLGQLDTVPAHLLDGKIAVDVNNHYPERDGPIPEIEDGSTTTSRYTARHFSKARVVKAFNAVLVNDLERNGRPRGAPDRTAVPIAGDEEEAKAVVAGLVDAFGWDPVDAGPLDEGWRFERARPAYCAPMSADALRAALAATTRDSFVEEGSWRERS